MAEQPFHLSRVAVGVAPDPLGEQTSLLRPPAARGAEEDGEHEERQGEPQPALVQPAPRLLNQPKPADQDEERAEADENDSYTGDAQEQRDLGGAAAPERRPLGGACHGHAPGEERGAHEVEEERPRVRRHDLSGA